MINPFEKNDTEFGDFSDSLGWLQCGPVKGVLYSPESFTGVILMEDGNCVHGFAAIRMFYAIDSKVNFIITLAGRNVDACYFPAKSAENGWACWIPALGYSPANLSDEEIAGIKGLYNLARSDRLLGAVVTLPEIPNGG